MGMLARAFDFSRRSFENPATKFSDPAQWLLDWATGGPSKAGIAVNQETASRLTAFWCGVRLLSETVASVPLVVYERQEPRGRRKAIDHPLFNLLHDEPNPDMSSFFAREFMEAQVVVYGNGYAALRRDGGGRVREIWPLLAQKVEPKRNRAGDLFYAVTLNNGAVEPWQASDIVHVPGLSFDGIKGKSVLGVARDAIGLGLAAQDYGATFFSRGGRVPGVLETQFPKLDADTKKNVRESWLSSVGGTDNWHQPAILPRGMKYTQIGIPPEDGQFIETRKLTVTEIGRILHVPPHLLYDLERATFSNVEHQGLEFVIYTMRPYFVRWEQELNRKLLSREERARFYIEFNMEGLLRGDIAARGMYYSLGRQWGWFSANDVLDLENRPGIGDKGDVYLTPFNMANAEELVSGGPAPAPMPLPAPAAASVRALAAATGIRGLRLRRRIKAAQKPIIEDRARQIVNREIGAVEKMLKGLLGSDPRNRRNLTTLRRELEEFYSEHVDWAAQRMRPVIASYAELVHGGIADELGQDPEQLLPPVLQKFGVDYSGAFGAREASEGRLQLEALIEENDEEASSEAIRTRLGEWGEKRPGKIAVNEATQFMGAASKVLYVAAGVTVLRWAANPGACPFCQAMDGRVAGVEQNFVNAGQGVDGGEGAEGPLTPSDNIGHPPLHSGCECDVVAG